MPPGYPPPSAAGNAAATDPTQNGGAARSARARRSRWIVALLIGVRVILAFTGSGAFNHRNSRVRRVSAETQATHTHHAGPVASLAALPSGGKIFLVQMGPHPEPYSVDDLAAWLTTRYKRDVAVLPALPLDQKAYDSQRHQYVAELLGEQVDTAHPEIAASPGATLIGITDADMYRSRDSDGGSYTTRVNQHTAVISTYSFSDHSPLQRWLGVKESPATLQASLRKYVLKDIAILNWHLRLNNDPTSLLHDPLWPDSLADDVYDSDLHPETTQWGVAISTPCLYFTYSVENGVTPLPGPAVRDCDSRLEESTDEAEELIQVDLQYNVVRTERTDVYVPGAVPIVFRRVLRPGGAGPTDFGASGTHSYNKYLSASSMSLVQVVSPDRLSDDLRRTPAWLPMQLVNRWVDARGSGRALTMTYHVVPTEHYEVKDLHGNVETYLPCENTAPCFLDGYRNAQGQSLAFTRNGSDRRLTRLLAPEGGRLDLHYDANVRLSQIEDNSGRSVQYSYNAQSQLARVVHADGSVATYEYDNMQRLLAFRVAASAAAAPVEVVRNTYDTDGRLLRQSFDGGALYTYSYRTTRDGDVHDLTVHMPDGSAFTVSGSYGHESLFVEYGTEPNRTGSDARAAAKPGS